MKMMRVVLSLIPDVKQKISASLCPQYTGVYVQGSYALFRGELDTNKK